MVEKILLRLRRLLSSTPLLIGATVTGRLKLQLIHLCTRSTNILMIFDIRCSNKILFSLRQNLTLCLRKSQSAYLNGWDEELLYSHYKGVSVIGRNDFIRRSTNRLSANCNLKWVKVSSLTVCEEVRPVCESLQREF